MRINVNYMISKTKFIISNNWFKITNKWIILPLQQWANITKKEMPQTVNIENRTSISVEDVKIL